MQNENLVLGFMGDVMIGRGVGSVIARDDFTYIWGDMLPLLRGTDINIINLEAALTLSEKREPKVFNFKVFPGAVQALQKAQITFANVANNHILDFSEEGLLETIQTLRTAGIQFAGAGENEEAAAGAVLTKRKNISAGLLGFTDNEPGWKAGSVKSGINYINISVKKDRQNALQAIERLNEKADLVIVSIHWGPNMREAPSEGFIAFAHKMIEYGADIIHGHSAHIFQGIEIYRGKLILYDTGEFVDDYAVDPVLKNDHSFFYRLEVSNSSIEKVQLIPVFISNCQVNLAKQESYDWCMKRVRELSKPFGTVIDDKGEILLTY